MDKGHASPEWSGYLLENIKRIREKELKGEIRQMSRAKQWRGFHNGENTIRLEILNS